MVYIACLLLLLISGSFVWSLPAETVRRTKYGYVRGEVATSKSNSSIQYLSFKGIPFAKPPIGDRRFKEAVPPKKWYGIKKTIDVPPICPQFDNNFMGTKVIGSEDCLYLDVYIPKTSKPCGASNLPVMLWIHPGNYVFLSANITGPDYFMEKPVVIVIPQYRLNVFGFLSTLDDNAPGNFGLKDQQLAMRWVRDNIRYFDGDPNRVTIFGESAGASSVVYHMLNPKSWNLFAGVIGESGTPLNRWALRRDPDVIIKRLAEGLGIRYTNNKELVDKLRKVPYDELLTVAFNISVVGYYTPYWDAPFSAIIETPSENAFISESAYKLLGQKKFARVPYLVGVNTEEGTDAYESIDNGMVDINMYQKDPSLFIPTGMNVPADSPCINKTIEAITEEYFPDRNYTNKYEFIRYSNQEQITRGVQKTVDYLYNHIPVYFYVFSYVGSRNLGYAGGVGHHEELQYLWYPQNINENPRETSTDKIVRDRMVTLWTNFAIYGNPTPSSNDEILQNTVWPRFTDEKKYLDIGQEFAVKDHPYQRDFDFWAGQYRFCGFPPFFTY